MIPPIPVLVTVFGSVASPLPQDSANHFHISVAGGVISGTEEYTIAATADGYTLRSTSHVVRPAPAGPLDVTQALTLGRDWSLVRYRLDVATTGTPQTIEAWRDGDTIRIQAAAGERGQHTQVPRGAHALVLDNLVVSHYQVLVSLFETTPAVERDQDWQFVVPQVVTAVRGRVTSEAGPGGLRHYAIDVAGTLVEAWADSSGRLMRVSVPLQQVEMVRDGFAMPAALPAPGPAVTWRERGLTIASDGLALPATLAMPLAAGGRRPIVVLVHGSGPNDRDETIGPNKPFQDLAQALAGHGIGTLRYDKRTFAFRRADMQTFTVDEEVIDDAVAAVRTARDLPEVDPRRVYLLGHSLGGTLAPLIAARLGPGQLAGIILLAPGARPLDAAVLSQLEMRLRLTGQPDAAIAGQVDSMRSAFARVRDGTAPDGELVLGAPAHYWRDLLARRPLDTLRTLSTRVLVLQGGKDYQVTKEDYDLVQQALAAKPAAARESHWFDDLNHLFMHVDGPSTGTEYGRAGHVDARVADAIAAWIGTRP